MIKGSQNANTFLDGRALVVGANHRSSSMILRDRLFVEDSAVPLVLKRLKSAGIEQALVLSTCDRVEVQAFCKEPVRSEEQTVRLIIEVLAAHGDLNPSELDGQTYVFWDQGAVRQIFAVTSSLDSLIIGEPQVLGQVKAANRLAKKAGMTSRGLESILQAAYGTAKRVRNETGIGERPVSIAAAATQLAGDLHGDLDRCTSVFVGVGEMGELIATDMIAAGLNKLVVTHPTERRAEEVARRLDCHTSPFDDLATLLVEADIVLTALGRRHQAITAEMVKNAISSRRHKPIFLIDTAIPGDIDPLVERIDDAFLYSLDELERVAMKGRAGRENEAGVAWQIIDADVDIFMRGQAERTVVPTLSRLRAHFERIREQALIDGGGDAEKTSRLLINRLLHGPSEQLRQVAVDGSASGSLQRIEEIIDRLFSLDDDDEI